MKTDKEIVLERLQDCWDADFPEDGPTDYALQLAEMVVGSLERCPRGSPVASEGSVHIYWSQGDRRVMLNIPGTPEGKAYVFWMQMGKKEHLGLGERSSIRYATDTYMSVPVLDLQERLDWLIAGE